MTAEERIKRLEIVVERLCAALQYKEANKGWVVTNYELLRQYVRGDLDGADKR